ncbi:hypothetical protein pb186bvf_000901 [Paramecium bursaria]
MDLLDYFNEQGQNMIPNAYIMEHFREQLKIKDIIEDDVATRIYKSLDKKQLKKNWTNEEQSLFVWLIVKFYTLKPFCLQIVPDSIWEQLSNILRRSLQFLKQQWQNLQKFTLTQYPWSQKEDELLIKIINTKKINNLQNKWQLIAKELFERKLNIFRSAKQCRERWINHLNPEIITRPWTSQDSEQLIEQVNLIGKRWSIISKQLKRNENQVKNKYNSLMKKQQYLDQVSGKSVKKVNIQGMCDTNELDLMQSHDFCFINMKNKEIIICDKQQFLNLIQRQNCLQTQASPIIDEQQFVTPFDSGSYVWQFQESM